jgi:hypothetical protein
MKDFLAQPNDLNPSTGLAVSIAIAVIVWAVLGVVFL